MKMHNPGTTLMELIVYISLVALVGTIGFTWFYQTQRQFLATSDSNKGLMQLYSALDLLVRDLRTAPMQQHAWIKQEAETLLWSTVHGHVAWFKQGSSLYRIEGNYDLHKDRWLKKKKSVALQNLDSIAFHVNKSLDGVTSVDVALTLHGATINHTIYETIYPQGKRA